MAAVCTCAIEGEDMHAMTQLQQHAARGCGAAGHQPVASSILMLVAQCSRVAVSQAGRVAMGCAAKTSRLWRASLVSDAFRVGSTAMNLSLMAVISAAASAGSVLHDANR